MLPSSSVRPFVSKKPPLKGDTKQFTKQQQRVKEEQDPRQYSKWALDSLLSKNKKTKFESGGNDWKSKDYLDRVNDDHQLDDTDDPDEEFDYDEEEDDEEPSIHRIGPDIDPKQLLHSLTNTHESGEHAHFSNSPINPLTRKPPSKHLDDNLENELPLPGAPRDLQAQIVKSRFVTLTWLEPLKNPEEIVTYSVYYKMNNNDRLVTYFRKLLKIILISKFILNFQRAKSFDEIKRSEYSIVAPWENLSIPSSRK